MSKGMTNDLNFNLKGGVNRAFGAVGGLLSSKTTKSVREDKEAEIETLRNVKIFLTAKLKQNEEVISTFQKDINILKEVLRVEKSIKQKTLNQLNAKTVELNENRQQYLELETKLRDQINTLSLREQEHVFKNEQLTQEKKKLKNHKALLKEEVLRQRTEISQLERIASQKTQALASLSDFFKNNTLAKVKTITAKGKTPAEDASSVHGSDSKGAVSATKSERSAQF